MRTSADGWDCSIHLRQPAGDSTVLLVQQSSDTTWGPTLGFVRPVLPICGFCTPERDGLKLLIQIKIIYPNKIIICYTHEAFFHFRSPLCRMISQANTEEPHMSSKEQSRFADTALPFSSSHLCENIFFSKGF